MFDSIYEFLINLGYTHPIHPPMTHLPIGMVIGACVFGLAALLWGRPDFEMTARYCVLLAFLGVFVTITFGYMDWQHYYAGGWLPPIRIKLILAGVLFIFLAICGGLHLRGTRDLKVLLPLYVLCLMTVAALGYFGGQLVYSGREQPEETETPQSRNGEDLLRTALSRSCPDGDLVYRPTLAAINARGSMGSLPESE
jgi:uncharacterized membrane protein